MVAFARDRAEPPGRFRARRVQRASGHDGHLAAIAADQIFRQLGQQLTGRRLIGPVGAVEEADFHGAVLVQVRVLGAQVLSGARCRCQVLRAMRAVPVDRALEAGAEVGGRGEAEQLFGARHVEHAPRLAVGLGSDRRRAGR